MYGERRSGGIWRRGVRHHWSDTLLALISPRHEGLVEIHVAGVDDFPTCGNPNTVTAGHARAEPEVDAGHAV